jgi:probable addiction module antidote protein
MSEKFSAFDVADYLDGEETIAEYLSAVLEADDTDLLIAAIGDVAKARGMGQIAAESGLGRESLYKALAPGAKPRFETIVRVLRAMGVQLQMTAASPAPKKPRRAARSPSRTKRKASEERARQ